MSKKVFLIDDDADDRELFCEALQAVASDFICLTAPNGRKALADLRSAQAELPDLIFLDINMPLMNGWQFLSILREQEAYKHIPVIIYSTSSSDQELQKALQAGAFCFFKKPSNYKDLVKSLESVVFHLNDKTLPLLKHNSLFYA